MSYFHGSACWPSQPFRWAVLNRRIRGPRYEVGMTFAAMLIAMPAQAEEVLALVSSTPTYTQLTPVETLAADPAAAAVLNRDLPGLLTDPSYAFFKTMSLKQMQQASGGDLSVVDVNRTVADLQMLPAR